MGNQKLCYVRRLITERRGHHGLLPPVEGYCYGKIFSIHLSTVDDYKGQIFGIQEPGRYIITHLPTGYMVGTRSTFIKAKETITALMARRVPWESKDAQKIKPYRHLIAKVIDPLSIAD